MKNVLTIAGSDSLSGGGLQADLRTFKEYGVNALNAVTCIVTVDPKSDKFTIYDVGQDFLQEQLETSLNQEENVDMIKIGMLGNLDIAKQVASFLQQHPDIPVILDPVLSLKEEGHTSNEEIVSFFREKLLPLGLVTTPNLKEAELLSGLTPIDSIEKMKEAAQMIQATGVEQVVIKGGQRLPGKWAVDVIYDGQEYVILRDEKLSNGYNNGAGCTFASSIAAGIALGLTPKEAIVKAKEFVHEAIEYGQPFLPGLGNVYQGGKKYTVNK